MNSKQEVEVETEHTLDSETDTEDNIYVYVDDEEENDIDRSAFNYSQIPDYVLYAQEEEEAQSGEARGVSIFRLLLLLLSNPIEGWKAVRRYRVSVENAQRNCFYPLLALMALSHFAVLFYSARVTLTQVVLAAVTSFVGYFAGYFCIILILKLLLPKGADKSMDTEFGKVFVIMNLSSLCLFFMAMELLPMLWPILIFLPLWTVYVICRGARFFRFPEDKTIFCTALLCLLIVGVPSLIEWALTEILPMNV